MITMNMKKQEILNLALDEYFVRETPGGGKDANPRVLAYFAAAGSSYIKDDSANAWCSAFINFIVKAAGLPISGSLLARSWLPMGQPTDNPQKGDLVIFWRDDIKSTHGHVSIFIRKDGSNIICFGGNQNDEVNISRYPASRVLGYRDITLPSPVKPKMMFDRTLSLGSKGEDVKTLQKLLKLAPVDGLFGTNTQNAVKAFQTAHSLVSDGVVGPITMGELSKI